MVINLELELVRVKDSSKAICLHNECKLKGHYERCYTHLAVLCPIFKSYYEKLTDEQKEILNHPERFYLGD